MPRTYHEVPSYFQALYSAQQIKDANTRIGKEISAWAENVWRHSHTDLLTVPVLRGGIFFFSDLVREISSSVELAPTFSQGYENSENTQTKQVKVDISGIPARGRAVLLVDDVCDSGRTLQVMTTKLKEAGAQEVRSAVLVKRLIDNPTYHPDWSGFEYRGPEWFVGYGMDDCNRWRNLDSIFIIKKA